MMTGELGMVIIVVPVECRYLVLQEILTTIQLERGQHQMLYNVMSHNAKNYTMDHVTDMQCSIYRLTLSSLAPQANSKLLR